MDDKRLVRCSKYLARHLRHQPERLGLTLQPGGWVEVSDLLAALDAHSFRLSREELEEVVERNDKRRFSFSDDRRRVRANQGHSVDIDLALDPASPPETLFHGTSTARLAAVMGEGLKRMARHHVHLSIDVETAQRVGARHGKPVVVEIAAGRMHSAGFTFFVTDNGVWLTAEVPREYLRPRS